ncbi:hypothetical protein FACS1894167_01410 [Synergistales bacterium]|nr:hypothetical protein FACS1894167_01410 [Synergistales bacterium]
MSERMSLKDKFPFKIGTTSYIIDGGILENTLWLADKVDEMQIVLFETPGFSNIPSEADIKTLRRAALDCGMSFTVHLPCDLEIGSPDKGLRELSIERLRRTVGLTYPLEPICWVLHISLPGEGDSERACLERLSGSMAVVTRCFNSPRDIAIENVHPNFTIEPPIIEEFDTSVCIDAGHLLFFESDVWAHLDRWLPRTRNIHLHGVREGMYGVQYGDHASLDHLPGGFLERLFAQAALAAKEQELQTITMEIFGLEDFERSAEAVSLTVIR